MWDRLTLVTGPADPAVSLADAKAHLRVDDDADDALIEALVESAAGMIDGPDGIGFCLQEQTWRLDLDGFNEFGWGRLHSTDDRRRWDGRRDLRIRLPLRPVVSVESVQYVDTSGDEQTMDAADYRVSIAGGTATLTPVSSWPTPRDEPGAVRIEFKAGEGTPAALRSAILLMVGHLYEHREAVSEAMQETPLAWDSIINRYRSGRVAA